MCPLKPPPTSQGKEPGVWFIVQKKGQRAGGWTEAPTQLKESMPTSSQSPGGCLHLQHVHLRQPPEGTICQLADVVSLKLQHLQAIEALERETLNQPNPIPIQVPMEMKPSGQNIPCVHLACTIPRSSSRFLSQWGNFGGVLGEPRVHLSWHTDNCPQHGRCSKNTTVNTA